MNDKVRTPEEEAWIEEAKRRMKRRKLLDEPGIPAEKFKIFRRLLFQRIKETGTLDRQYAEDLLQKLQRGEL